MTLQTLQGWCDRWRRDTEDLSDGKQVAPAPVDSPERYELHHLKDYFVSASTDEVVYLRPFPSLLPPAETSGGCAVNGWGQLR